MEERIRKTQIAELPQLPEMPETENINASQDSTSTSQNKSLNADTRVDLQHALTSSGTEDADPELTNPTEYHTAPTSPLRLRSGPFESSDESNKTLSSGANTYLVRELVGTGTHAACYRATDAATLQDYVLKVSKFACGAYALQELAPPSTGIANERITFQGHYQRFDTMRVSPWTLKQSVLGF